MSGEIRVTITHVRHAKLCTRGARQWFKLHGLDYNEFIMHGLPVETIEATNDVMGLQVAAIARQDAAGDLDG